MKRTTLVLAVAGLLLGTVGCNKGSSKYPGTEEGAKALLTALMNAGPNAAKLSLELKPTSADYEAIFTTKEMAQKAETEYGKLWGMIDKDPIRPKEGQTELKLFKATTEELRSRSGGASEFPGGYGRASQQLKPGLTIYRWKFVKPGESLGMAFDGLVFVNGHWVIVPKPWRITG
jgi:hypothetical protein